MDTILDHIGFLSEDGRKLHIAINGLGEIIDFTICSRPSDKLHSFRSFRSGRGFHNRTFFDLHGLISDFDSDKFTDGESDFTGIGSRLLPRVHLTPPINNGSFLDLVLDLNLIFACDIGSSSDLSGRGIEAESIRKSADAAINGNDTCFLIPEILFDFPEILSDSGFISSSFCDGSFAGKLNRLSEFHRNGNRFRSSPTIIVGNELNSSGNGFGIGSSLEDSGLGIEGDTIRKIVFLDFIANIASFLETDFQFLRTCDSLIEDNILTLEVLEEIGTIVHEVGSSRSIEKLHRSDSGVVVLNIRRKSILKIFCCGIDRFSPLIQSDFPDLDATLSITECRIPAAATTGILSSITERNIVSGSCHDFQVVGLIADGSDLIIGDDVSLESPFISQDLCKERIMLRVGNGTYTIESGHDTSRTTFLDCILVRSEIVFTDGLFISPCADATTVGFLIVEGKVLDVRINTAA